MTATLRRRLLLPALLLYCALLLTAALPAELTPPVARPVTAAARSVFAAARVRPFAFVFEGRRGDIKRGALVLSAHVERPDGTIERVLAAPSVPLRGYRWVQPPEETLVMKALVFSPANGLMRTQSESGQRARIARLRRDRSLAGLARFACRSSYAAGGRATRAWLTLYAEGVSYRTGRRRAQTRTIHVYDCAADRSTHVSPWPAAALDAERLPYPLPGTPDPLFLRAGEEARRAKARVMFEKAPRAPLRPLAPWDRPQKAGPLRAPAGETP